MNYILLCFGFSVDLIQFFGRFHVLVLHLPIGILLLAALLEVHVALFQKERAKLLNQVWFWGAVSAIFACILGYMLSLGGGYNDDAVFIHKSFGISVAVTSIICTVLFSYKKKVGKLLTSALVSLQLFLLFATGHYGANMTHGETYLVEHAPNFVRAIAGFEPHQGPRPPITEIQQADIYLDVIQPIFKANCVSCHNDAKAKGKLNLANIEGIKKGGKTANTLGNSELNDSELYKRITMDEHSKEFMPAEGKTPLTNIQVKTIAWWIKSGAPLTGSIQASSLSKEDKKTLAQNLGLLAADNAWPLANKNEVPGQVIGQLQQHGFLVKTIANKINYLDVDYSSNLNAITDEAISALVAAKDYVAYLNLINSQINHEQIAKVATMSNLLRLRLNKTPLNDKSVEALQTLPNLKYLNLFGTKISDSAVQSLTQFTNLKQVYVGQTKVTESAIAEIAAIKPELQVIALSNKLAEFQESTKKALAQNTKDKAEKAAK